MDIDYGGENVLIINAQKKVGSSCTEIEYYIQFHNCLNLNMYNVRIPLTVPKDTLYINNSLYINDKRYFFKYDNVIEIPVIKENGYFNIRYSVYVKDAPVNGEIVNKINLSYLENDYEQQRKEIKSNKVVTKIKDINLVDITGKTLKKQCSKKVCTVGDIIEYKLYIKNDGEVRCDNLIFMEEYDGNSEFVKGSFKINDKAISMADIYKGVYIGTLEINADLNVTYRLKVTSKTNPKFINSKSYLMYPKKIENKEKVYRKITVDNDTRLISPILMENTDNNEVHLLELGEIKTCSFILENKGNVDLENIKVKLINSKEIEFKGVRINGDNIKLDNVLTIETIKESEQVIIELNIKLIEENINNYLEVGGEVTYKYCNVHEDFSNEQKLQLKTKVYSMAYGNFNAEIVTEKKYVNKEEEIEGTIQIKNTGNVNLFNLDISEEDTNTINIIEVKKVINNELLINPGEIKSIPIKLKVKEGYNNRQVKFRMRVTLRYRFNNEEVRVTKIIEKLKVEIIDEKIECIISSNKSNFLLGEKAYFNIKICNKGCYKLKEAVLKLNIPYEIDIIDKFICIRGKEYSCLDIIEGINIGDICVNENITIKYCSKINNINFNNSVKTHCTISGYYILNNINERVYKEYESNFLSNRLDYVSIKAYLKNNKEILLTGQQIKYSTIVINDGTLPVGISYKLDYSSELEEVQELSTIDGEYVKNLGKLISIEPNDGIIIENTYVYSRFKGVDNISAQAIIDVYYENYNGKVNNYKEIRTEILKTEITNTTFKEICVEEVVDIASIEPRVAEVINIYLNPVIIRKSTRRIKRDYSFNLVAMDGYRLDFIGNLNYTIEYLSCGEKQEICLISDNKIFVSNIILPNNFIQGEFVEIKPKVLDTSYKIIEGNKIFISVDLLINTSM